MTPDRYSKVVLTVIAVCLVWVCLRDIPFVLRAQAAPGQVGTQAVRIVDVEMEGFNEKHAVPVRIVVPK